MKITEILVESQQVDEGPLLNKIGAGIGKAAGTVAKGIGAVAGGVVGAGKALAKGYQAGKATVGGAGDDAETDPAAGGATPAATAKPAAGKAAPATTNAPAAGGAAPATTNAPAAGGAAPAAGGSQYAQVKANIDKLDKKGKQRILQLLQKEVGTAPAAPATPAADPGAGAMGNMAGQLAKGGAAKPNTMANAPVSKTNTAKPGNPNAAPAATEPAATEPAATEPAATEPAAPAAPKRTGGKVAGKLSQTPGAIRKREATARKGKQKPAAPSQAEIDADREKIMGVTSDSIIRTRPMMAESFSLFRKR